MNCRACAPSGPFAAISPIRLVEHLDRHIELFRESAVRTRQRLEHDLNRRASLQARHLRLDVRQHADLRRRARLAPQPIEMTQNFVDVVDGIDRRVEPDERIARAHRQPRIDEQPSSPSDRRSDGWAASRDDSVPARPTSVRALPLRFSLRAAKMSSCTSISLAIAAAITPVSPRPIRCASAAFALQQLIFHRPARQQREVCEYTVVDVVVDPHHIDRRRRCLDVSGWS